MRSFGFFAALVALSVALIGCGRSEISGVPSKFRPIEPHAINVDDVVVLRDFSLSTTVAKPQASWAPNSYMLLARSVKGLMLMRAGVGTAAYRTDDATSPFDPYFWGTDLVVLGPEPHIGHDEESERITIPPTGLMVAEFTGDALQRPVKLTEQGYRPRPWGERVVYSVEDEIVLTDLSGEEEDFVAGFLPEPQPRGPGIAWQTKPVFSYDYWTGKRGNGDLVVRWRSSVVDTIADAVHPRWTPWGGIMYTALKGSVPATGSWWTQGSDVMHVAGPGEKPQVIMRDAHWIEPHPRLRVAAITANDGRVHLVDLETGATRFFIARGERPRWSHDGRRLMLEEPNADDPSITDLHIYVLKLEGEEQAEQ
ncbi:MAG: hypothetical protein PF961_23180 [Planctomycetota bacterium]|jgi:hypothetical protein|nr:hypothetical protein [Planctomycetota bacterium]